MDVIMNFKALLFCLFFVLGAVACVTTEPADDDSDQDDDGRGSDNDDGLGSWGSSDPEDDGPSESSNTYTGSFTCCINGAYFACESSEALKGCIKGDYSGCDRDSSSDAQCNY